MLMEKTYRKILLISIYDVGIYISMKMNVYM